MAVVAGNSQAVVLGNLVPDTQYQLTVAAIFNGRRVKSRPVVFRTMGKVVGSRILAGLTFSFSLELLPDSTQQDTGYVNNGPPVQPKMEPAGESLFKTVYPEFGDTVSANQTSRELPTVSFFGSIHSSY